MESPAARRLFSQDCTTATDSRSRRRLRRRCPGVSAALCLRRLAWRTPGHAATSRRSARSSVTEPDIAPGRSVPVRPGPAGRRGRYRRAGALGADDHGCRRLRDGLAPLDAFGYGLDPFSEVDDRVDRVLAERGEDGDGPEGTGRVV